MIDYTPCVDCSTPCIIILTLSWVDVILLTHDLTTILGGVS